MLHVTSSDPPLSLDSWSISIQSIDVFTAALRLVLGMNSWRYHTGISHRPFLYNRPFSSDMHGESFVLRLLRALVPSLLMHGIDLAGTPKSTSMEISTGAPEVQRARRSFLPD